jgi:hypothetical protein
MVCECVCVCRSLDKLSNTIHVFYSPNSLAPKKNMAVHRCQETQTAVRKWEIEE